MIQKRYTIILTVFAILLIGFIIRIWNLTGPDMIVDDALYAFRAVGYVDYVGSINKQSTPASWFDEPRWWQYLSFHDNPPLVFATQWIFFKIGGVSLLTARLPFVIAGLLSVFFIFLLGRHVFNETAGIIGAFLLAVMNYAVWISRIGLLDGFVMLFVILSLYFFLKAKENERYYLWWALASGAGILSKYTFFFMIPVFCIGILLRQREALQKKMFYYGLLVLFLCIVPLIIYNVMMWQERGHPDAALSTLFGIHTDDFKGLQNRTISKNFNIFGIGFDIIHQNISLGFQILIAAGFLFFAYHTWRSKEKRMLFILLWIALFTALGMLSLIGASERYNVITIPLFALITAIGLARLWERLTKQYRILLTIIALPIIIWEIFFTFQNQLIASPYIKNELFVSSLYTRPRWEGYNQLDHYVEKFYEKNAGAPPVILFKDAPQLAQYQLDLFKKRYDGKNPEPQTHLLVYDDRMDWTPSFWTFERRKLYDMKPIHSMNQFLSIVSEYGVAYYTNFGFTDATFLIAAGDNQDNTAGIDEKFEQFTLNLTSNVKPADEIKRPDGKTGFFVYTLPLE